MWQHDQVKTREERVSSRSVQLIIPQRDCAEKGPSEVIYGVVSMRYFTAAWQRTAAGWETTRK
jgi:hypothetical protein